MRADGRRSTRLLADTAAPFAATAGMSAGTGSKSATSSRSRPEKSGVACAELNAPTDALSTAKAISTSAMPLPRSVSRTSAKLESSSSSA